MAEISDHYLALDVSETASAAEIKRAYRNLAQELHPDRGRKASDQVQRFRDVQEAYEVLSNPASRLEYDIVRHGEIQDLEGGRRGQVEFGFSWGKVEARTHAEAEIRLSFDFALNGGEAVVALRDGAQVHVLVPKGVRSGMRVRFRKKGFELEGGGKGDLYVMFWVAQSPRFRREGNDLHIIEPITVMDALLGTQRSLTNAYGRSVKINVPPGTQPGERLRLRGQGVQTATQCGDLYVEVCVTVPRSLTHEQRAALSDCASKLGLR